MDFMENKMLKYLSIITLLAGLTACGTPAPLDKTIVAYSTCSGGNCSKPVAAPEAVSLRPDPKLVYNDVDKIRTRYRIKYVDKATGKLLYSTLDGVREQE
jgi:hypothetical protein